MAHHAESETNATSDYLRDLGFEVQSIEPLSGSNTNYVWRVTIDLGRSKNKSVKTSPCIVKHAKPFVASNPAISFSLDRQGYEADALRNVASMIQSSNQKITTPTLYLADLDSHMLIMSDGGNDNLKESYATLDPDGTAQIGRELGKWLARLHTSTADAHIGAGGNVAARHIYRYAYAGLVTAWEKFGMDQQHIALANLANEKYGSLLLVDDECICMGDFWPGNIIIKHERSGASDVGSDTNDLHATVVDWEMIRRGCGATDAGQFAAEAFLLDRFRSVNRGLCAAFFATYTNAMQSSLSPEDYRRHFARIGVHCGVHLGFWPLRVKWADNDETRKVALIAAQILKLAIAYDEGWASLLISN